MAAGEFVWFDHGLEYLLDGTVDFDTATINAMLVSAGYTPSLASDSAWADIASFEVDANGYSSAVVADTSYSRTFTTGAVELICSAVSFATTAPMDAKLCVFTDGNDRLLGYVDLNDGGSTAVQATSITVAPPGNILSTLGPERSPGTLAFETSADSVNEDAGSISVRVLRSSGADGPVYVDYTTADGEASAGVDYTSVGAQLSFADNDTEANTNIPILSSSPKDETREFTVQLTNAYGGATIGSPSTITISILDVGSSYTITHYASPTGSGAHDGSSPDNAWTMDEAIANAGIGDVVQFAPGVYTTSGTDSNDPEWVIPSGSSGSYCIFVAQNRACENEGEDSTILSQLTNAGSGGAIIGAGPSSGGADYFILDGFDFPDYQGSDADGAYKIPLFGCTNIKIRGCTSDEENQATSQFNHGFIFTDGVDELDIFDCRMRNNSGSGENAASVMFYGTTNARVYYNHFHDNTSGLFIKGEGSHGQNGSIDVRYSKFRNHSYMAIGIGGHQEGTAGTPSESFRSYLRNNLFDANVRDIWGNQYSAYYSYVSKENNTFYNSPGTGGGNNNCAYYFSSAATSGNVGNTWRNNLLVDAGACIRHEDGGPVSDTSGWDIDGNFYYNNHSIFNGDVTVTSLATWQSTYSHDENGTQGSDPQFESTTHTDSNYLKPQSGSPAEGAATDGDNVGAYETGGEEIGVRSNPTYA